MSITQTAERERWQTPKAQQQEHKGTHAKRRAINSSLSDIQSPMQTATKESLRVAQDDNTPSSLSLFPPHDLPYLTPSHTLTLRLVEKQTQRQQPFMLFTCMSPFLVCLPEPSQQGQ